MFAWLEELYRIRRENKACETCNVLRLENARLLIEQGKLLDRILEKPVEKVIEQSQNLQPILPRGGISWNERKKVLEAEDRRRAQILNERKVVEPISTEELEKELNVVEQERTDGIRS